MSEIVATVVKKLLNYSFEQINWEYEELTPSERSLCSREEFEELVAWYKQ